MKILRLPLKKNWFKMTKSGEKKEDYREMSNYWYSRLCLYKGEKKTQKWWERYFEMEYSEDQTHTISFIHFDENVMTLGYPKNYELHRIIRLEHKGIERRVGKEEWGAEPGKSYFVIKHGEILNEDCRLFKSR